MTRAPAIGITGAMGLVVSLADHAEEPRDSFLAGMRAMAERIRATRPTAVNLPWALDRMIARAHATAGAGAVLLDVLRAEATAILDEDIAMCRRILHVRREQSPAPFKHRLRTCDSCLGQ